MVIRVACNSCEYFGKTSLNVMFLNHKFFSQLVNQIFVFCNSCVTVLFSVLRMK